MSKVKAASCCRSRRVFEGSRRKYKTNSRGTEPDFFFLKNLKKDLTNFDTEHVGEKFPAAWRLVIHQIHGGKQIYGGSRSPDLIRKGL